MPDPSRSRSTGLLVLLAGLLAALVAPLAGGAGSGPSLRARASVLTQRNASLAAAQSSALLGLFSLDIRLQRADAELAAQHARALSLRRQLTQVRMQIGLAQQALTVSDRRLANRLRGLYEQGEVDPLSVLLGATSLNDAITQLDDLKSAAGVDRAVIAAARSSRTSLQRLSSSLALSVAASQRLESAAAATAASLGAARAARTAFLARLAAERSFNAARISALVTAAHAVAVKAQALAPASAAPVDTATTGPAAAPASAPAPAAPSPVSGGRTLFVTSSGYALSGRTATGAPVGWGVVAVDPSVIPLGTRLTIPGYGEGVAADTGGAVQGATIDLWFPTQAQALAWGRRTVTVTLH